jgi:hypothetical protein
MGREIDCAEKRSLDLYSYQMISDFQPGIGGQMVFQCFGDQTYRVNGGVRISPSAALTESVDNGVSYGEKYIEIYETDVVNLPKAIHYAHRALVGKQKLRRSR